MFNTDGSFENGWVQSARPCYFAALAPLAEGRFGARRFYFLWVLNAMFNTNGSFESD